MTEEERAAEAERCTKLLDLHVNQLAEHFDCVQIFCSKTVEGGDFTFGTQRGAGNVYAREGHVREWLTSKDEEARDQVREKN